MARWRAWGGAAAAVVVALAVGGCGGDDPVDGAAVFERRCAGCHGIGGEGGMGPRLQGQATVETVRAGRPARGMPPFAGTLTEEEIEAVVAYANEAFG